MPRSWRSALSFLAGVFIEKVGQGVALGRGYKTVPGHMSQVGARCGWENGRARPAAIGKVEWRTGRPRDERKRLWNRPGQGKEWEGNGPRDSGRGLACRSGVERQGGATHGARFQPPVEPAAGGKGLVPGLRRELPDGEGIWGQTARCGALYGYVCVFGY